MSNDSGAGRMRRLLWLVRDGWLIAGIVVVLLIGLELAYRAQGALRNRAAGTRTEAVFFDHKSPWLDDYLLEQSRSEKLRWKSYTYFRRQPFRGAYINVDSTGHRVTRQERASEPVREVFFFGGSTMFGAFQRDSATIPSLVARRLRDHGIHDVAITNFGETGYVSTQEVIELLLQLRSGKRPAAVVFYDGINDVYSTVQNGIAGLPQNEVNRARDFRLGRQVFNWRHDVAAELAALAAIGQMAVGRVELVDRLRQSTGPSRDRRHSVDSMSRNLVESYGATAELVGALARSYGFRALFVWQPTVHGTSKPMTAGEHTILQSILRDPHQSLVRSMHLRVPAMLDSRMIHVDGISFLNLARVFAEDSAQVFVDQIGHTNERANGAIAAALLPRLAELLSHDRGSAVKRPAARVVE